MREKDRGRERERDRHGKRGWKKRELRQRGEKKRWSGEGEEVVWALPVSWPKSMVASHGHGKEMRGRLTPFSLSLLLVGPQWTNKWDFNLFFFFDGSKKTIYLFIKRVKIPFYPLFWTSFHITSDGFREGDEREINSPLSLSLSCWLVHNGPINGILISLFFFFYFFIFKKRPFTSSLKG